ncbi:MAG: hydrophobic/amphiphilic exporter-1, HAE1 family [Verrucomicrobia bacterium]|nr:MAG: hydrophobic/amphiphilic exporter-1, HAE1 family [Verrucomicrobiota bacterium]
MNLSEAFIRRPVMTTLLMLAVLGFGIFAFTRLPVSDLPNVDFPTLSVTANLPGASPETMASSVATVLERQFTSIAGIDSMTSSSALGLTNITIQFNLDRNLDAAALDVQSAITAAQKLLPRDLPNPPTYKKVNPADSPVIFLAVTSESLPLSEVNEYADTFIAQRLSTIAGVAQVNIFGPQKYAVRAQLDPRALASQGLGIDEVVGAMETGNVNLPTGTLHGPNEAANVQANGQLTDAAGFRRLVVAYRNGAPVRLEQLGNVIDSVENTRIASWFNSVRGIVLAIQKQPGSNTVAIVDGIRGLLPQIEGQLPPAVKIDVLSDKSVTIREAVHEVEFTLVLSIVLVVAVIFVFLRNVRATLIPSVAMPLSVVGTFMVMHVLDYSVDTFSLLALTLAVGFVVDDAIVVLENIVRHIEEGETPMAASLKGAREIGFTILSMTLSLVAVFVPVLFMGGILGRLLREFAVVIAVAILVSGFISLTLTPMLCARFLKAHGKGEHGWFYRVTERFFEGMRGVYERTLRVAMGQRVVVLLAALASVAATAWLFQTMPKGFVPNDDNGQIFIMTEAAQGVSFEKMSELQQRAAAVLKDKPYIEGFMSSVGVGGPNATGNTGRMFLNLVPRDRRPPVEAIIAELRPELSKVPGLRVFPQVVPLIRLGGTLTKSLYQFTLSGPDLTALYEAAPLAEAKMRGVPGLMDVTSDLQITSPQVQVTIDRDKAASLQVTAAQIEMALANAYSSRQVSTIYTPTNQYQVVVELMPEHQRGALDLNTLYVRSGSGKLVPLSAVTTTGMGAGPLTVQHLGQLPAVILSFNLEPGIALGEAIPRIEAAVRPVLPDSVTTAFQGTAQAFQSSLSGLGLLLLMAVLVIYLVLGILYESFIHPLTILSGLPSAGFGALLALKLWGYELNVYGFVGILLLIGIVKKNAIMMIDFALEAQRDHGKTAREAIFEACLVRFRPIMMTTMAAIMGTLPIALGIGGSDARRPLGIAIVGGLVVSQLLTLYITPVIYLLLERLRSGRGEKVAEGVGVAVVG